MAGEQFEVAFLTGFGLAAVALGNVVAKRPLFSRLHFYALYGGVGFGAGQLLKQFNLKRIAERDLAIWDYVNKHPEDFPEINPKKYKEVLEVWHPVR